MIKTLGRAAGCGAMLAVLAVAAGCDRVGNPLEALGAKIPPPDEFQVIASKPLKMPASNTLPEPTPGAPSPLAPDPNQDARAALLGSSGSQVIASQSPSSGEQVLLSAANASAQSGEIRVQLEEEQRQAEASKPYEPPTVLELLGGKKKEKEAPDLLDPQVEAERLQREGAPAPSNPNVVVEEKQEKPEPATSQYPIGRPQSPFNVDPTKIN